MLRPTVVAWAAPPIREPATEAESQQSAARGPLPFGMGMKRRLPRGRMFFVIAAMSCRQQQNAGAHTRLEKAHEARSQTASGTARTG
jgi:hypothetical protein